MSKKRKSKVSVWLYVLAAVFIFSAGFVAVRNLPDIDDVPGDDTTVTDDQGNVVPDPDNPGTSTGNGRVENLKMYPAYATSGSRETGYYGFSITDLNPNTTYSLYLSFVNDDYHYVHIVSDGNRYYHSNGNEGYGEYNENTLRYGVGALKLRTDANGILTVYCMMEVDPNHSTLKHDVYAAEYFERYTVALYATEGEPSEPVELPGKMTFNTEKILYDYVAPTTPDGSGSSSNSGSSGGNDSGSDPVYVLDGNYLMREALTVSKGLQALFEDFEDSEPYEFYDNTNFKCCTSLFEDCEGYDGDQYYGMKLYYYEGDIDLSYETTKSHTLVYDQPSFKATEYRYLHFDEVEVSEAFYLFITENSTKVS